MECVELDRGLEGGGDHAFHLALRLGRHLLFCVQYGFEQARGLLALRPSRRTQISENLARRSSRPPATARTSDAAQSQSVRTAVDPRRDRGCEQRARSSHLAACLALYVPPYRTHPRRTYTQYAAHSAGAARLQRGYASAHAGSLTMLIRCSAFFFFTKGLWYAPPARMKLLVLSCERRERPERGERGCGRGYHVRVCGRGHGAGEPVVARARRGVAHH